MYFISNIFLSIVIFDSRVIHGHDSFPSEQGEGEGDCQ